MSKNNIKYCVLQEVYYKHPITQILHIIKKIIVSTNSINEIHNLIETGKIPKDADEVKYKFAKIEYLNDLR